jgi:hypothetical protein
LFTQDVVVAGLTKSLAIFGQILDLGIYTDSASGFFMGTGYAVLDIYQPHTVAEQEKYQTLSHQLSWCESTEELFHATWNDMPTWCRYCHKDGHTKYDCALSKARILCYACHQQGHRSFECPRRNLNSMNKRQDRKSYQTKLTPPPTPVGTESPKMETLTESKDDDSISDSMSTCEEEPVLNEEEQIFLDTVEINKQELDQCDPSGIKQAIQELEMKKEIITFVNDQGERSWKLLQKTEAAVAIIEWISQNKFWYLDQSPSIVGRRPSQAVLGDHLPKYITDQI